MMRHGKERAAVGTLPYAYRLELPAGAIPVTTFFRCGRNRFPCGLPLPERNDRISGIRFDGYAGDPRSTFSLSYLRAEEIASFSAVPFPAGLPRAGAVSDLRKEPDGTRVSLFLNLSTDTLSDLTIRHAETCSVTGGGMDAGNRRTPAPLGDSAVSGIFADRLPSGCSCGREVSHCHATVIRQG